MDHTSISALFQGWSGFAFPILTEAVGPSRGKKFRPSSVPSLLLDGNTAHSSGWWWESAGAFYFGGALYYNNSVLEYNPGRSSNFYRDSRSPCTVNACASPYNDCSYGCPRASEAWNKLTNSKAFLTAGIGLVSVAVFPPWDFIIVS
jgi:hypothetical protein